MRNRSHLVIGLMFLLTSGVWGQVTELEAALNRDFKGHSFTQKAFQCGEKIRYSVDGSADGRLGPWTKCGDIRALSIELPNDHTIVVTAERIALRYDPQRQAFDEMLHKKLGRVVIEIAVPGPMDEAAARAAIAKVFLQDSEHLSDFVPDYWKPFLVQREIDAGLRPKSDAIPMPAVPKRSGITAPRVVHSPDPAYDPFAKSISFQGMSILWLVVDETGAPRDVRVATPLGLGLDDNAVEAVRKWKFKPAMRDGAPIAVLVQVQVNFRRY